MCICQPRYTLSGPIRPYAFTKRNGLQVYAPMTHGRRPTCLAVQRGPCAVRVLQQRLCCRLAALRATMKNVATGVVAARPGHRAARQACATHCEAFHILLPCICHHGIQADRVA